MLREMQWLPCRRMGNIFFVSEATGWISATGRLPRQTFLGGHLLSNQAQPAGVTAPRGTAGMGLQVMPVADAIKSESERDGNRAFRAGPRLLF